MFCFDPLGDKAPQKHGSPALSLLRLRKQRRHQQDSRLFQVCAQRPSAWPPLPCSFKQRDDYLYRFPDAESIANQALLYKWNSVIDPSIIDRKKDRFLCSEHFRKEDVHIGVRCHRLTAAAFPIPLPTDIRCDRRLNASHCSVCTANAVMGIDLQLATAAATTAHRIIAKHYDEKVRAESGEFPVPNYAYK